jgi:hypothetical protein
VVKAFTKAVIVLREAPLASAQALRALPAAVSILVHRLAASTKTTGKVQQMPCKEVKLSNKEV